MAEYVASKRSQWQLGSVLGEGLSGEVREAIRCGDEQKFAMKVVDLPALISVFQSYGITADILESNLMREIEVMRTLRHRNIIYLEETFWVEEKLYMCMELVEGKDLLRSIPPGGLKEEEAKGMFFQLCSAVSFCHANNVIHGDLKPENILIRERDHRLKLIDFGFSHIVKPGEHLEVLGGTILYSPPDDQEMTFAFDDWACGVIYFAMLTCTLPFRESDLIHKRDLVLKIPDKISNEAIAILVGLLNPQPLGRVSVSEVLASSEWLATERCKELPETITTLALARKMSRPCLEGAPSIPISRQSSGIPLSEHGKDIKILGRFLQKIKRPLKLKTKRRVAHPMESSLEKREVTPPLNEEENGGEAKGKSLLKLPIAPILPSLFSRSPSEKGIIEEENPRISSSLDSLTRGPHSQLPKRKQIVSQMVSQMMTPDESPVQTKKSSESDGSSASSPGVDSVRGHSQESPCEEGDILQLEDDLLDSDNGFQRKKSVRKVNSDLADVYADFRKNGASESKMDHKKSRKSLTRIPTRESLTTFMERSKTPPKDSASKQSGNVETSDSKSPSLLHHLKKIPPPSLFPHFPPLSSDSKRSEAKEISSLTRECVDQTGDKSPQIESQLLNGSRLSFDTQRIDSLSPVKSPDRTTHSHRQDREKRKSGGVNPIRRMISGDASSIPVMGDSEKKNLQSTSKSSSKNVDVVTPSDIEFLLAHLKTFEESERKFVESLNQLLQFKSLMSELSILSPIDADTLVPDSLKDIRSIHQNICATLRHLLGESVQSKHLDISMTDIACTLEAIVSILASERASSHYLAYSKEYVHSLYVIRAMRKSGVDLCIANLDYPNLYSILNLPLTHVTLYSVKLTGVFEELDESAKKSIASSLRSLEKVCQKCRANVIPIVYC